ncbi:MAG: orotidine-5'-phosphate decarboxylase [Xanthomonadales bacterium]|nr:orotidine-5'-phosphate decarboxylase [Xanthomonadales bacterium]NIN60315.1 orotidine-5'-phosphate decarboxylase [Xanthomonadales bacterium]NIN75667.1 orotidine-5'-phosphate decarboxylase [Xanthomonadales bacterium]NIO14740.1 orotidine-5'-phosphate decarboxylase [Xanthomonadales bacterium]NIP12708.1 orotidine-5'-phosphate decarboxylase [Xanthomonadales bacterium]
MNAPKPDIPARDRLIFALDVPDLGQAQSLIRTLGDSVNFYKLGLEVFLSGHYFDLLAELRSAGKKVFADLKLFDIPATVAAAVRQLARHRIDFCTVHGNDGMLRAAAAAKGDMKILAVTALTSLDEADLKDLGFQCDTATLVLSRARRALALGCDGVISSGLEVPALRREVDHRLIAVCPGIRPVHNDDDQRRVVTPARAIRDGADYLVIGRPIRDADDPRAAAEAIQSEIADALAR